MTVNFNQITVLDIEGKEQKVSVAADLGNAMYMQGQNIEECELGKTIYMNGKTNTITDIDDKQAAIVKKFIGGYPFVLRKAVEEALTK